MKKVKTLSVMVLVMLIVFSFCNFSYAASWTTPSKIKNCYVTVKDTDDLWIQIDSGWIYVPGSSTNRKEILAMALTAFSSDATMSFFCDGNKVLISMFVQQ